ncbi:acyl carrier protein [Nocardia sp. NPDC051911]|uniref:acyl carrier protein n=1 Tax=Nocardia sp. NPDC051911 TaxID=3154648 RepID=UPI003423876C
MFRETDSVLDEVAASFGVPAVSPDQTLAGLGVDSVAVLRCMTRLQNRFDVAIDVVDMFTATQVRDLVELVAGSIAPTPSEQE